MQPKKEALNSLRLRQQPNLAGFNEVTLAELAELLRLRKIRSSS